MSRIGNIITTLVLRWKTWRMKARARKAYDAMEYRSGDAGRALTHILRPDVALAEREYERRIEWLRQNDPKFPESRS